MASRPAVVAMDRAAIERAIPHRSPYLFVDRVLERTGDTVTAEWDIRDDMPALAGHYPGNPVLPGALISEFTFQCAAILFAVPGETAVVTAQIPVLAKIEEARFKKMVAPGETLHAVVETIEKLGPARFMKALVTSHGETVARLKFTVTLVEKRAGA